MENEKKKTSFFQIISKSFKWQIMICVALSLIVIILYFILDSVIEKKVNYRITNDIKLINQIEQVTVEDNKINIKGYAFFLDMDSDDTNISILLRSVKDSKEIWADAKQISRTDINFYFSSDLYENSGFNATVKSKKFNVDECYEIIVKLDYFDNTSVDRQNTNNNVSKTVLTDKYIVNGELYSYNPYEFDQPDLNIKSELLREVFTNGRLCFYQKNEGMYVYQYNDQLYWIANEEFDYDEDKLTYIQYQLYTPQINKLPENRMQYGFDNLDFNFEEYEYVDENTAPYRVAIKDIPADYPITYIVTGVYDTVNKAWIWQKQINMNPIFKP